MTKSNALIADFIDGQDIIVIHGKKRLRYRCKVCGKTDHTRK